MLTAFTHLVVIGVPLILLLAHGFSVIFERP